MHLLGRYHNLLMVTMRARARDKGGERGPARLGTDKRRWELGTKQSDTELVLRRSGDPCRERDCGITGRRRESVI